MVCGFFSPFMDLYIANCVLELLDSYLNGPRILSARRLSCLILSQELNIPEEGPVVSEEDWTNFDLLICTTHFVGDGMALHQFANDFFTMLSSKKETNELFDLLKEEWRIRYGGQFLVSLLNQFWRRMQLIYSSQEISLPAALEDRLPSGPEGRFHQVTSRVDFMNSQDKAVVSKPLLK